MRERLLIALFRSVRRLLRALPFSAARALGRFLGRSALMFAPRERAIMRSQTRFALGGELAAEKLLALPGDVFAHLGELVVEALRLDELLVEAGDQPPVPPVLPFPALHDPPALRHVSSSGQAIVDKLRAEGRGAVALSGHLGCFELLAAYHLRRGVPLGVIAREPNYPVLEKIVRTLRASYAVETYLRDDPRAARRMIVALRSGKFVAALIDQDTPLDRTYSTFFRLPAAYPRGPLKLAMSLRVPILMSFIIRTGPAQHHVHTEEIPYDADEEDAEESVLSRFGERLEQLIRTHPDQWLWWHRRWRRRPGIEYGDGSPPPSTAAYIDWLDGLRSGRVDR